MRKYPKGTGRYILTGPKSKCCGDFVHPEHGCDADLGHGSKMCDCTIVTTWYECNSCHKPCDIKN